MVLQLLDVAIHTAPWILLRLSAVLPAQSIWYCYRMATTHRFYTVQTTCACWLSLSCLRRQSTEVHDSNSCLGRSASFRPLTQPPPELLPDHPGCQPDSGGRHARRDCPQSGTLLAVPPRPGSLLFNLGFVVHHLAAAAAQGMVTKAQAVVAPQGPLVVIEHLS